MGRRLKNGCEMLRVQKKQGLENELFQIMYRCERTSFILQRFKNPNLLFSPLNNKGETFAAFYGRICYDTLEPVAVERGEVSASIVKVATASAGVKRIQGRKKTRIQAIIAELAERSSIMIQNSSNPLSRKYLDVRPYDRTRCYF